MEGLGKKLIPVILLTENATCTELGKNLLQEKQVFSSDLQDLSPECGVVVRLGPRKPRLKILLSQQVWSNVLETLPALSLTYFARLQWG